jgi:hypothetical protein
MIISLNKPKIPITIKMTEISKEQLNQYLKNKFVSSEIEDEDDETLTLLVRVKKSKLDVLISFLDKKQKSGYIASYDFNQQGKQLEINFQSIRYELFHEIVSKIRELFVSNEDELEIVNIKNGFRIQWYTLPF